jgi:hypothetical protein
MRRILLRLVVVAVMAAMLLVMAIPALADRPESAGGSGGCEEIDSEIIFCGGGEEWSKIPVICSNKGVILHSKRAREAPP